MKLLTIISLFLFSIAVNAQSNSCATVMSSAQMDALRAFQRILDNGVNLNKKAGMQYVPVQVHLVGTSKGVGYFPIGSVLQAFCDINQDYIPTGFHFYLAGPIDYINDDDLYQGNSDAIWSRAQNYKKANAVNVFFHGTGMQWCGVYFSGIDVVFIKHNCQGPNATTLTHELGHFFGLPHTFSGWENGNNPGSQAELVNGSNCRNAGDGFCDTKPDYLAQRWGCPLGYTLVDANNARFTPDSSIYMSYAMDQCMNRFSQEQMATMRNNLAQRQIAQSSANLDTLGPPALLFPINNDSSINAKSVNLSWHSVKGAIAYHVQVARFGAWDYLNADLLVFDTVVNLTSLYGDWPYSWRVKAVTAANTCGQFSAPNAFMAYEPATGLNTIHFNGELKMYPNPAKSNCPIVFETNESGKITVFNSAGEILVEKQCESTDKANFIVQHAGLYVIRFSSAKGIKYSKLVVVD